MPYLSPPRRVQTTSRMAMTPTWIAVLVGSVVGTAGVAIALAALAGVISPSRDAPVWVLVWVGGLFALGGGALLAYASRYVRWQRRARGLGERWRRDHPWRLDGAADDSAVGLRQHALGLAFMIAILGPLHVAH